MSFRAEKRTEKWLLNVKWKNETEPLARRPESGMLANLVFLWRQKFLALNDLALKEQQELETPRNCYVCKTEFTKMHHFYATMCKDCGDFNYVKRFQTANIKGQLAIIRGSRLKIGTILA